MSNKPNGWWVGKLVKIGTSIFKVLFYVPKGKDSENGYMDDYKYIVQNVSNGKWDYFDEDDFEGVYKEDIKIEEMTLKDICKALGKEIKIIK